MQTTTYNLTAVGPGGTATSSATVNVNTAIQANLGLSSPEVHYKRVGDKVLVEDSTALDRTAENAATVSIDPLGTVSSSGSRDLQVVPKKNDLGQIDETVTYTLNASNGCGGTETKTATLHIVGSIEQPEIKLTRSVYFQTDRPRSIKSDAALLVSEKETLKSIADAFHEYLTYQPDARLVLSGHADKRGPQNYNKPLSERRAALAKKFLVDQVIPEADIETQAFGKEQNLTADQVKQEVEQDSSLSAWRVYKLAQFLTRRTPRGRPHPREVIPQFLKARTRAGQKALPIGCPDFARPTSSFAFWFFFTWNVIFSFFSRPR
jgi:outer membrane protein OmpA-like peptidoglycan-associated protein